MNWRFEKDSGKCSEAKKIIISSVFVIVAIMMNSWASEGFAADYIPPNSTISNGVPSAPGTSTPTSSAGQCPPGHSPEYCNGYIAGYNDAIRSHQ